MKLTTFTLLLLTLSFCGVYGKEITEKKKPDLVALKSYDINPDWTPQKILGRDYWYVLFHLAVYKDMKKYGDDLFFEDAGFRVFVPPYQPHYSPWGGRGEGGVFAVALRGIDIFGPESSKDLMRMKGTVLSASTKFAVPENTPAVKLKKSIEHRMMKYGIRPESRKVENLKQNGVYVSPEYNFPQEGTVTINFERPEIINRVVMRHGFRSPKSNGKYWKRNYLWIADHFVLQMKKDGKWINIPGTEAKENLLPETVSEFKPVKTKSIRICIFSQKFSDVKYSYADGEEWKWFMTRKNKIDPRINGKKRLEKRPFYLDYGRFPEREFVTPPPIQEKAYKSLKKKFPESFLGFQLGEWPEICKPLRYRIRGNQTGKGDNTIWKYRPCLIDKAHNPVIKRPETRKETHDFFRDNIKKEMKSLHNNCILMDSYMHWHHYAAEWGAKILQHEQGGGTPSSQMFIAFLRGAARQYNLPWWVYLPSFGPQASRVNYKKTSSKDSVLKFGPNCGISASLLRRRTLMSYFAGANFITYETDSDVLICVDSKSETKKIILSPHAKGLAEIKKLRNKNLKRGVCYTPIAILTDYYHGLGNRSLVSMFWGYRWWNIKATKGDLMLEKCMFTLFPQLPFNAKVEGPGWSLENTPFGDVFDVILPNPPSGVIKSDVLSGYKILTVLGDLKIENKVKSLLMNFVKEGGTLFINSRHCSDLPPEFTGIELSGEIIKASICRNIYTGKSVKTHEFSFPKTKTLEKVSILYDDGKNNPLVTINDYGKGKVIAGLPPYLLDDKNQLLPLFASLMKEISRQALPVAVEGSVEYLENKTENGWLITLINNNGVYKKADQPPEIKPEEASTITMTYGKTPNKIIERLAGSPVDWKMEKSECKIKVALPPGEVKVIEIIDKK